MKVTVYHAIMLAGLMLLSACSSMTGEQGYFHDRTADYQKGDNLPPLKMPPGVKEIPPDPYYVIPEIPNPEGPSVVLYPPGSLVLQQAQAAT